MRGPSGGGGGGGVILLNPAELRRSASRLRVVSGELHVAAGRLRGAPQPELAPAVADATAVVADASATVDALVAPLSDSADELVYRALWGDIADELIAGRQPSAGQLAQFMDGLRSGKLVRYANDPWEAEYAGEYLAGLYRSNFDKDPKKLIELSTILKANEGSDDLHGSFFVGFVQSFGADNLAKVPRVIQTMESWRTLTSPSADYISPTASSLIPKLMGSNYQLDRDPVGLLSSFAMALAVATQSAQQSGSHVLDPTEDALATNGDTWAVAQLLSSKETYGSRFLVQVFQHQLIPLVQRDTSEAYSGAFPHSYLPIGLTTDHALAADPKQLILDAVARNGEASALALTTHLSERVHLVSPFGIVDSNDPVQLLYGAHWDDGGQAFARVYIAASDHLQGMGAAAGTNLQGNLLTWQIANQVLHAPQHLDAMTDALAHDLAAHHLPAIFESAGKGGYEQSGSMMDDGRLYLSPNDQRAIFQQIAGRPDADAQFLHRYGAYQASFILDHASSDPRHAYSWGYEVGSVNQVLLNAHDAQGEVDFAHASERQKLIFGAAKETLDLLTADNPALHIAVAYGSELGANIGAPDATHLLEVNYDAKLETAATVRAALASGFYASGHFHEGEAAPPSYLVHDGRLANYATLRPDPQTHRDPRLGFDQWALNATGSNDAYGKAIDGANDALAGRAPSGPVVGG